MLTNIEYIDVTEYDLKILPVNTFCARCDHLMVKGRPGYRLDAATYVHERCPKFPLKNMSTEARLSGRSKKHVDGTYTRYQPIAVVHNG